MQVVLFDIQQRTVTAELSVPFVKYVVWSSDMEHVGLLSKHAIVIADKKLANACTGVMHVQIVHFSCTDKADANLCWF